MPARPSRRSRTWTRSASRSTKERAKLLDRIEAAKQQPKADDKSKERRHAKSKQGTT